MQYANPSTPTMCRIAYPVYTDGKPSQQILKHMQSQPKARLIARCNQVLRWRHAAEAPMESRPRRTDGPRRDGTQWRVQVDMVMIPGSGGDFGVLPGHVPTVSALKPGVMEIHKTSTDISKVAPRL